MDSLMQKTLERFRKSPDFKAAEVEEIEAGIAARQTDVDRLAQIEVEVVEDLLEPMGAVKKKTGEFLKMQKALLVKEREVAAARLEELNIRNRGNNERAAIEQRLKDGAIPSLREFISEASSLWGLERHKWNSGLAPENEDVGSALAKELHKRAPDLDKIEFLRSRLKMPARDRISQIRDITARAEVLFFEPSAEMAEAELERLKGELKTPQPFAA